MFFCICHLSKPLIFRMSNYKNNNKVHGTVHQTLTKILMKMHGTVHETNGIVHQNLPKRLMNMANNNPQKRVKLKLF